MGATEFWNRYWVVIAAFVGYGSVWLTIISVSETPPGALYMGCGGLAAMAGGMVVTRIMNRWPEK